MDDTIRRLARVLGASSIESIGHDVRFVVEGSDGSKLKGSIEGERQRFMAVLVDPKGITRSSIDVAPVSAVLEDSAFPGRVILNVGSLLINLESRPTLAIEVLSKR